MGRKLAHSAKDVIKAIKGTAGIQTSIAKKLNVTRQTVASYIERWPTVKEAYEEEKRGVDDAALSVVIGDIVNNRDVGTAKWWLARKMPDEFGERVDVTSGGEKLTAPTYIMENRPDAND